MLNSVALSSIGIIHDVVVKLLQQLEYCFDLGGGILENVVQIWLYTDPPRAETISCIRASCPT